MWRRKRGSFVLNCRFAVFLTPNWLVEFHSWREKLNCDHELFGFSYELFSRCSENRNFLSCNSNRNFKFNFILFNFFQSLWLHRAHVEDVPHLYVSFNNFFFTEALEALALAYDYITDSDGRCFIRTLVSKNFSEIGKKNESETLSNLSSNQTIFFYYSPIISPILMAGVSIWAFLSENLSGIGRKKIIGNALKS